jgi:hypothetical protein
VTEERIPNEPTVYTYSDDRFPFAIQYLIFDPSDNDPGFIAVIGLFDS